jgi:hypothetical protein
MNESLRIWLAIVCGVFGRRRSLSAGPVPQQRAALAIGTSAALVMDAPSC